ncbi:ROK family protein [Cypionkella sp.]|uniref:ROK family protein n=1 Tax=Cypionkella sp. TaxID=2811411 RepID=UPI002726E8C3|nr:ROK family protein [Cypionkella sp.]MDO8983567.1 ROK family protein [Cypionkella sp.]MDP2048362.1 ROK family protein [Cypionkella sp.]
MTTGTAIGIDIGGTRLRAARVTEGVIEARASTESARDPAEVTARVLELVEKVRNEAVTALGIGVPGQVHATTRQVLSGGYVDLSGFDFAGQIEAATALPVTLENDATMALLGEAAYGAAQGQQNVVMLTIGTGIGGAILDQGQVLRGRGAAGQLGHIGIDPQGRPCVCGKIGCVETTSSGTAFGVHLGEAGFAPDTRAEDLLSRQDPNARAVIHAWAAPLRAAIDSLIATLNPDCVLIGGGAGTAAHAALAQFPAAPSWFNAAVLAASLGDDAGVIGAATTALKNRPHKRAVFVNGVPASGKSGVARALSDATGWPILALDTIKNPFLTILPPGDRLFNRTLGRASYAAIFDLIADAPANTTVIIDAWFGFQPIETLQAHINRAGLTEIAELWCHAPPEVIGSRYAARLGQRPAGHPGAQYVPELISLAAAAKPTGLAPRIEVDTTKAISAKPMTDWLAQLWR